MAEENSKTDWFKIIVSLLTGLSLFFGVYATIKQKEEEQKKINALNQLAMLDSVHRETDSAYSRLSQQKDNLIDILQSKNRDLAEVINKRDENILALSETVVRMRSAHIVIQSQNGGDVSQGTEGDRVRVDFNQTQDPMRVSGFTLTNPAEATIDVAFIRPLRLRTTITQNEDGAWRTYFESDWPNLEIDNIDTVVNPNPVNYHNTGFVIGLNTMSGFKFDRVNVSTYLMYDFGSFGIGPALGFNFSENTELMFGVQMQYKLY